MKTIKLLFILLGCSIASMKAMSNEDQNQQKSDQSSEFELQQMAKNRSATENVRTEQAQQIAADASLATQLTLENSTPEKQAEASEQMLSQADSKINASVRAYSKEQEQLRQNLDFYVESHGPDMKSWDRAKKMINDAIKAGIHPDDLVQNLGGALVLVMQWGGYSTIDPLDEADFLFAIKLIGHGANSTHALKHFSRNKDFATVALLVLSKADINQIEKEGNSLMHQMFKSAMLVDPRVPLLLFKLGIKPDQEDSNGVTPLLCVCHWGVNSAWSDYEYGLFKENIRNLVRMGASPYKTIKQNCTDKAVFAADFLAGEDYKTVLARACERDKWDWVNYKTAKKRMIAYQDAVLEAQEEINKAVTEKSAKVFKALQPWMANDTASIVVGYAKDDYVMPQALIQDIKKVERDVEVVNKFFLKHSMVAATSDAGDENGTPQSKKSSSNGCCVVS